MDDIKILTAAAAAMLSLARQLDADGKEEEATKMYERVLRQRQKIAALQQKTKPEKLR